MLSMLKKGDEIVTIGGMYGTVKKIGDDYVELEIANRTRVRFLKRAISSIVSEEEEEEEEEYEEETDEEAADEDEVVEGDADEGDEDEADEGDDDEAGDRRRGRRRGGRRVVRGAPEGDARPGSARPSSEVLVQASMPSWFAGIQRPRQKKHLTWCRKRSLTP